MCSRPDERSAGSWGARPADEPSAAAAGEEAERPSCEDEQSVLYADQVEEMYSKPGDPGERSAEADPLEIHDGFGTADSRKVALVAIAEGRHLPAAKTGEYDSRGVPALLHGDGCESGKRVHAIGVADRNHVSEREDLGVPEQREVGLDDDSAGVIELTTAGAR
jgi:hypothetical protein